MDSTQSAATPAPKTTAAVSHPKTETVQPQYRTTFFFVSTMLAGIVVGWILLLGLLLRRY